MKVEEENLRNIIQISVVWSPSKDFLLIESRMTADFLLWGARGLALGKGKILLLELEAAKRGVQFGVTYRIGLSRAFSCFSILASLGILRFSSNLHFAARSGASISELIIGSFISGSMLMYFSNFWSCVPIWFDEAGAKSEKKRWRIQNWKPELNEFMKSSRSFLYNCEIVQTSIDAAIVFIRIRF